MKASRSPGWHRRLRAKRSKARLLIKEYRASNRGLPIPLRVVSAIKLLRNTILLQGTGKECTTKGGTSNSRCNGALGHRSGQNQRPTRKREDKGKDKPQNVLSSYESFATSSAPSSSSAGGTQDSLLFKEFVNYMKENKDEPAGKHPEAYPGRWQGQYPRGAAEIEQAAQHPQQDFQQAESFTARSGALGSMVGLSQRGNSTAKDQARRESGPSFQGAPRSFKRKRRR